MAHMTCSGHSLTHWWHWTAQPLPGGGGPQLTCGAAPAPCQEGAAGPRCPRPRGLWLLPLQLSVGKEPSGVSPWGLWTAPLLWGRRVSWALQLQGQKWPLGLGQQSFPAVEKEREHRAHCTPGQGSQLWPGAAQPWVLFLCAASPASPQGIISVYWPPLRALFLGTASPANPQGIISAKSLSSTGPYMLCTCPAPSQHQRPTLLPWLQGTAPAEIPVDCEIFNQQQHTARSKYTDHCFCPLGLPPSLENETFISEGVNSLGKMFKHHLPDLFWAIYKYSSDSKLLHHKENSYDKKKIKTSKSPFFISTYDLTVSNFNITSFVMLNTASSESYLIPFSSRGN